MKPLELLTSVLKLTRSPFPILTVAMLAAVVSTRAAEQRQDYAKLIDPLADATEVNKLKSRAQSATVVEKNAAYGDREVGHIEVRFSDGHTETLALKENATEPHVSKDGAVGWVDWTAVDAKGYRVGPDKVRIRRANASMLTLAPHHEAPFIEVWAFSDDGSSVIIKSRQHHGPAYFVKYNLATGKLTDHIDGFVEKSKMPSWAQPYSDQ
jgi:hypothetical protein